MILGINASNIRAGGGLTHLVELLRASDPGAHGFDQVVLWSGSATLERVEDRPWLRKEHPPLLDGGLASRLWWQRVHLARSARAAGCAALFAPGASDVSGFRPLAAMSQNLLPFEWKELRRFGLSWTTARLLLLRLAQARTLRRADLAIFLTEFARKTVVEVTGPLAGEVAIVPHGIAQRFFATPRPQRSLQEFTETSPCRILYVSIVDAYKHQWNVVEAVGLLRASGIPATLELVGGEAAGSARLRAAIRRVDPEGRFVSARGALPHARIHESYLAADLNVFASSCENLPIILLEGMAAGLPTVCSARGPMPEVLGDAGDYCDPESPSDIARAIRTLLESHARRDTLAQRAFDRARTFSWSRCADETFGSLARLARSRGAS